LNSKKYHILERRGKRIQEHRLIFKELNINISDKIVHHIDNNGKNNNFDNLKILSSEEHTSLHHAGIKKNYPKNCKRKRIERWKIKVIKRIAKRQNKINYSNLARQLNLNSALVCDYIKKYK